MNRNTRLKFQVITLLFMMFYTITYFLVGLSAYNNIVNIIIAISTLFLIYLHFRYRKKSNYFDFETIFITLLVITGYLYPLLIYDPINPFSNFFNLQFNVYTMNKSLILYSIAISAFMLGISYIKNIVRQNDIRDVINTRYISIIVIILSLIFIYIGSVQYFQELYLRTTGTFNEKGVWQVMALLHTFTIVLIATEYYNVQISKEYKIHKVTIIAIIGIGITMLYAGNRTFATYLILPIIILFYGVSNGIKFYKFILILIIGTIIMWIIQRLRAGLHISIPDQWTTLLSDLIIPSRNNYIVFEYVNNYGFTYGKNMLNGLIGIIPSLERILVTYFDVNTRLYGSAEIFTDYTFNGNANFGLGTTIIADVYLSFGVLGIIVLFFSLGYFSQKYYIGIISMNYKYIVIYSALASFSIFLVRASFTHPIKIIVWSYIVALINKRANYNK